MKTIHRTTGPFREQPYFTIDEIERICSAELKAVGLYPSVPTPVRIDRFIEKRFGAPPGYEDLPNGVLGFTRFGLSGVKEIVISQKLEEKGDRVSVRRLNATLAHEAGHGLLHAHLFVDERLSEPLFGEMEQGQQVKVLCRDDAVGRQPARRYDGRWWEFQANQAIGALLLPKPLVEECLRLLLVSRGMLGIPSLPDDRMDTGVHALSETFDVNPVVARIRISELYPETIAHQLTL